MGGNNQSKFQPKDETYHLIITHVLLQIIGIDLKSQDKYERTLLHIAAERGDISATKHLIQLGADINARDIWNSTPLQTCVTKRNAEITRLLVEAGANINASDYVGLSILHTAVRFDHYEHIAVLLRHGAALEARNEAQNTALHLSSFFDCYDSMLLLIENGAQIEVRNDRGDTPLHYVSTKSCADLLIKHGADINALNNDRKTPLQLSCEQCLCEITNAFIENGADIETQDVINMTPLHVAVVTEQVEIISLLIKLGAKIETPDIDGCSPLHSSCRLGRLSVVNILMKHGADVDAINKKGATPLHLCSQEGFSRIAETLFDGGADVMALDFSGKSALHYASYNGHIDICSILRKAGADINARDSHGRSAIGCARYSGHNDVAEFFRDHGAKWEPVIRTVHEQEDAIDVFVDAFASSDKQTPSWCEEAVGENKFIAGKIFIGKIVSSEGKVYRINIIWPDYLNYNKTMIKGSKNEDTLRRIDDMITVHVDGKYKMVINCMQTVVHFIAAKLENTFGKLSVVKTGSLFADLKVKGTLEADFLLVFDTKPQCSFDKFCSEVEAFKEKHYFHNGILCIVCDTKSTRVASCLTLEMLSCNESVEFSVDLAPAYVADDTMPISGDGVKLIESLSLPKSDKFYFVSLLSTRRESKIDAGYMIHTMLSSLPENLKMVHRISKYFYTEYTMSRRGFYVSTFYHGICFLHIAAAWSQMDSKDSVHPAVLVLSVLNLLRSLHKEVEQLSDKGLHAELWLRHPIMETFHNRNMYHVAEHHKGIVSAIDFSIEYYLYCLKSRGGGLLSDDESVKARPIKKKIIRDITHLLESVKAEDVVLLDDRDGNGRVKLEEFLKHMKR